MYEYDVLTADSLVNAKQLNELAAQGWRLVAIVKDARKYFFYMERLKPTA